MKIDEYAPERTPMSSAKAKSRSVWPPKTSRATIGSSVQSVVAIERVMTSRIERLTIWLKAARGMRGTFSRMRSKTMIVS